MGETPNSPVAKGYFRVRRQRTGPYRNCHLRPILSVNAGHKHFSEPTAPGGCIVIIVN